MLILSFQKIINISILYFYKLVNDSMYTHFFNKFIYSLALFKIQVLGNVKRIQENRYLFIIYNSLFFPTYFTVCINEN